MGTVRQRDLRNDVGAVLRRVEAGERLIVTVSGRPVAELAPIERRRWVGGEPLAAVLRSPRPEGLMEDISELGGDLVDPFAR